MELFNKVNYLSDIQYIISSYIREYDISKANINVLLYKGVLNIDQYNYYYNLDRRQRQIKIGLLERDNPDIAKILSNGILEIKKMFFEVNDIRDEEVLAIKNDAIFLVNKIPKVTKFGNVEFLNKNTYTSYYLLIKNEFYYYYDMISNQERIEIKGINDNKLELHKQYFIEFLCVLFSSLQTESIKDSIDLLTTFYSKYINLELDIGYYRPLTPESMYILKTKFSKFKAEYLSNDDKKYIDIGCNMDILRELHGILSGIYFTQSIKKTRL